MLSAAPILLARSVRLGPTAKESKLQIANTELARKNYDKAIEAYRAHLRLFPTDYETWTYLGAAYYYAGQPRKAQQTLQRVERVVPNRSYNYYLQGLCFSVLGMESTAQKYWEYAGYFNDEGGSKATIELALSFYKQQDLKAKLIAQSYLQRFPKGQNRALAQEIAVNVDKKIFGKELVAEPRPNPELSLYKFSRWSLLESPHFWSIQTGFLSEESSGFSPTDSGELTDKPENTSALLVNASIGVGPIRKANSSAFAGYSYRQRWNTDNSDWQLWFGSPFDLKQFPLRGELLERTHQVYGDIRQQFAEHFLVGAYTRLEFARVGSSILPSSDDSELRITQSTTDTQLLIPWAGYAWTDTIRTVFYLYLRKEIHNDSPEHSNKTWDFTGDSGDRAFSLGLTQTMEFPAQRLAATVELFQYEFIFNDYWLDYTRQGGILGLNYNIWKGFNATAAYGMYTDDYKLPRIKQGDCSSGGKNKTSSSLTTISDTAISNCTRKDNGNLIQIGLYWDYSPNVRIAASFLQVENSSGMKEYSENKQVIRADFIWAFPGVRRVSRLIDRYADLAFTKDTNQ